MINLFQALRFHRRRQINSIAPERPPENTQFFSTGSVYHWPDDIEWETYDDQRRGIVRQVLAAADTIGFGGGGSAGWETILGGGGGEGFASATGQAETYQLHSATS